MAVKKDPIKEDLVEKPKKSNIKKSVWIFVCFIVALLLAGNIYFFLQNKQLTTSITADKKEADKKEAQDIYKTISKFMELPKEEPVLATVIDKTKLQDQSFFSKAQNGDKLLVFSKARKALLYRPTTSKVVEFAPLSLGDSASQEVEKTPSQVPATAPSATKPASRSATITPAS